MLHPTLFQLAQLASEIETINEVAKKDDRWLFIAVLVLYISSLIWLVRWGNGQLEKRDAKIEAMGVEIGEIRDKHGAEVSELRDKHEGQLLQFAEKFSSIVQENSKAFVLFAQSMGEKAKGASRS